MNAVRSSKSAACSPSGYDEALRTCFGVNPAAGSTTTLTGGDMSVTRVICNLPGNGLSNPLPPEDAWLLTVQLRHCPEHDLWIDGKRRTTGPLAPGSISIYDLRSDPRVNSISPFANLHFHLPMARIQSIADQEGFGPLVDMPNEPGIGFDDAVIAGLGASLAPAFDAPSQPNRLFIDHVTQAIAGYVAQRFATGQRSPIRNRRVLDARQWRAVASRLDGELFGDVTIDTLGDVAGLPPSEFNRAFLNTVGEPPHRWLIRRRIERAIGFIRAARYEMPQIARYCGFADEQHLKRALAAYGRTGVFMRH
ncbi:AraC family transcriptional regulator [Sphingopyxis alaskensis]|jgi:AraC-like DNA-binding protein|uniref:AraC family transcriptional regulator n=1 Tax=Sphingopyxis alaskensis TaxID=117207 RepID=UPI00203DD0DF|nr:AraC family transcriptional regulator [Sphingopyxis alaskensis]MCM3419771.1 AraC family transcriptional regulator [Sphingopyxis alaskensis]